MRSCWQKTFFLFSCLINCNMAITVCVHHKESRRLGSSFPGVCYAYTHLYTHQHMHSFSRPKLRNSTLSHEEVLINVDKREEGCKHLGKFKLYRQSFLLKKIETQQISIPFYITALKLIWWYYGLQSLVFERIW